MKFTYKALGQASKQVTGELEADTKSAAIASLTRQGLRPLSVRPSSSQTKGKKKKRFGTKVNNRELVIFTRQLSTMVSAGVPLPRAMATLGTQAQSKYFKTVIGAVAHDIESGLPLGDSFGKFPDVFSEVYVNMVRAGEAGGILDEILKRVASQTEKDATIRKKIKGAMTYPTVILTITIAAFFGIMVGVIPKIGKILKDLGGPNAHLPVYTEALLNLSNFCLSPSIIKLIPGIGAIPVVNHLPNLVFLLIAGFIAGVYILRYIRTPSGKFKFHSLLLHIPILRDIIIKIAISRFSRTFASLTSAGVSVLDALEVTGGAIGNKVIEAELKRAAIEVRNGRPLSEPLAKSKNFPPIISQMLAVGEETGQIDTVLVKVAEFYDEEVDTVIESLSSIIEPVMIIVLGSLVGLIAASVMGPIASLSQNVGKN
jgi:type IV pilus assembly protein PilC